MKIIGIVETQFSASHTVPGHPQCAQLHGHVWHVRVDIPFLEAEHIPVVARATKQYQGTDLDRYMPGVQTTCSGLAVFFREQLSDFPVESIEVVTDDGFGARVEWVSR
jgi:hypothetical protein